MKKILIVEDEGLIANNLADSLRRSGYGVTGIASSGEDALAQVRALKPDLMLMDIHLGGVMDGIETAEKIRSGFSIPLIFLTAHATPEILDRAKRTYPFGYLVKPIRQVDLVSAVEIALYKHEMERKLKQREAWLATTLRCAGDGVIVTDASGRIEFLNDLSKRILCLKDRDVVGQYFCNVVRLKQKYSGALVGDLVQLAILQGATMSIGSELILADESRSDADLEGEVALCEIDGSIVGTVFTFRDVTIRNSQEEHRRRYLGTQACVRLASAVSTELKTLLQPPVEGGEGLLQSGPIGARSLASISRMVDQLDVVKCNNASYPAAMNLNALIADACNDLLPGIPSNVELAFQLQPALDRIYADPIQIKQMLASLILYSQDCMPAGGTIYILTRNYSFERRDPTGQAESYVSLTVGNTSREIQADEAHRLFEPFSGADPSADKWNLRLFLVHRIVSNARGSIRAQAKPGQGMSFEIILPRSVVQEAVVSSTAAGGESQEDSAAILLLQADHDVRSLVSESLERNGYSVVGARDYAEALDWMTVYPGTIALLITDLDLSHESGPALLEKIAARHPGIKVVFTADRAIEPEARKVWLDLGARVLDRPFRLEELLGTVNEMLAVGYPAGSHIQPRQPAPFEFPPELVHVGAD
jgi:hypothetical protein